MHINTHFDDQTLTVELEGRLDTTTTPKVSEVCENSIKDCELCILELAGVDYVSSAGLRLLLLLHKRMEAGGGKLLLRHVNPGVLDILEMTGFTSFLVIE